MKDSYVSIQLPNKRNYRKLFYSINNENFQIINIFTIKYNDNKSISGDMIQ